MVKYKLIILILLICQALYIQGQNIESSEDKQVIYQNIRGRVIDNTAGFPLVGVTIHAESSKKNAYSISDVNGYFLFEKMPVGYYNISFSMVGYEKHTIERVYLTSGRELFITQHLQEAIELLEEVTILSFSRKDKPINIRSLASSRSFSLEETTRYAGSYGDPARMAANYAGVMPARDNRNDIIIRGNSPIGLNWIVEGMEIPNPNHFGSTGSTGGPITIINTNLLSNSDFHTSNYPAEYSNSIAGVFDLNMRNGNPFKREHWGQLGWNGLEFGTEGPLPHVENASYIMSYRYSIVDILSRLQIKLPEQALYHDFSFKINVPGTKYGNFSLSGIRGDSKIDLIDSEKTPEMWMFDSHSEDIVNVYRIGAMGLTHTYNLAANTLFITQFSVSGSQLFNAVDSFSISNPEPFPIAREISEKMKFSLKSQFKHKLNPKTDFSLGAYYDQFVLNYVDSQYVDNRYQRNVVAFNQPMFLLRAYSDVLYRFNSRTTGYFGVNIQALENTKESVIEPRFSFSWNFIPKHTLSIGSGLYSQMQPLMLYYVYDPGSRMNFSNRYIGFTRSWHNLIGYDFNINSDFRVKMELYYQYLYNVPVSLEDSAYSIINYGAEFYLERKSRLVNSGTGENYGIELTLEKFWNKNYFFLLSGSLFESKYTGADGVERNTAFNGNYAFNFLAGYELYAPSRNRSLNFGLNFTYAGGMPYVPYDIDASMEQQRIMYDWDNAYKVNRDDYRRLSFRIGVKRHEKRFSMETAIDFQYRTNYTSVYLDRLDLTTGEVVKTYREGFYPMGTIKVSF